MPEPISIITLCIIGFMCGVTLVNSVKDEWRERHAKKFSNYAKRTFSSDKKLYAYLFSMLREHAKSDLIVTQSEVRDPLNTTSTKPVKVVGDTVRFVWRASNSNGMWLYLNQQTLEITMFCRDVYTRDVYVRRLKECRQDAAGQSHKRFELTEVWVR